MKLQGRRLCPQINYTFTKSCVNNDKENKTINILQKYKDIAKGSLAFARLPDNAYLLNMIFSLLNILVKMKTPIAVTAIFAPIVIRT